MSYHSRLATDIAENEHLGIDPKFNIGDRLKVCANSQRIYRDVLGKPELALMEGEVIAIGHNGNGEALYTLDIPCHYDKTGNQRMAETHLELVNKFCNR